ncbi:saccharopine dehydrogenase NADP-binding domain-containing protein, partial [Helicobacter ganmani]|uniref:saccharopine dehydrogenase NADP-binding domain-containing protein n=1 Tax=Helicobacter ganmani TaxID=60246 RepID=UPI003A8BEE54
MAVVLQIGAGGVGGVVAHKMAQNREVFSRIILASRTLSKCKAIADSIRAKGLGEIEIDAVDADNVESLVALINKYRPKVVVNVALPYQDLKSDKESKAISQVTLVCKLICDQQKLKP